MSGNKVAPHVARAIGAVQAKNAPAGRNQAGPAQAGRAAHLDVSVAAGIGVAQAKPGPAGPRPAPTKSSPPTAPADHLRRALAAAQARPAQAKIAVPAAAPPGPAPHVARAMAVASACPATTAARIQAKTAPAPAPHVAAAIARPGPPPADARIARLASHLQAAQAKMSPPHTPAAHVPSALAGPGVGVLQASRRTKKDLDERKKKVKKIVETANKEIKKKKLTTGGSDFFESKVTSFQDQKIVIKNLPQQNLKLTRRQSHVSSLAYIVKHHFKTGPELQIGLLRDRNDDNTAFVFSSNTSKDNRRIEKFTSRRRNLTSYYQKTLRRKNVQLRLDQLRKEARKLKITKLRQILSRVHKIESNDEWRFLSLVSREIAFEAHINSRAEAMRLRMKAARRMAYRWKLRHLPIKVTKNQQNIHSESSILKENPDTKKQNLELVVGTKVPCISCLTFFKGKKVPDKILEHTSATWLSESSMKQLGFDTDEIKKYLLHIATVLKGATVYQHLSRDGEIPVESLDIDNDPSTDSEDESAIDDYDYTSLTNTKAGTKLQDTIHDFIEDNF